MNRGFNHPPVALAQTFKTLREHFPALRRQVAGRPVVYLDSAATSLRPDTVIDAGCNFCRNFDGNPHRGMHALSYESTREFESARTRVASWLDVPKTADVVITRNATAAINLVARGFRRQLGVGDNIVITRMEHHANLVPWQQVAKASGATLRYLDISEQGELVLDGVEKIVDAHTKVVALTHVSNVLGTVNPVSEVVAAARRVGARVLLDAAQSVGHMPVSFRALDVDWLVFSAHKCYGPTGLGFLIGKHDALEQLDPTEYGGDMIEYVSFEEATWAEIPHRFEAGTANAQAVSSFPASIDFIESVGLDWIRKHEVALAAYAIDKLSRFEGMRILGPLDPEKRGGLVAFHDPFVPPHDLSTILDEHGVAVRAGHHCAQPLHRHLGIPASTRASFGVYATEEDIDLFIEAMKVARKMFGKS